jgi:hypothetical protein
MGWGRLECAHGNTGSVLRIERIVGVTITPEVPCVSGYDYAA